MACGNAKPPADVSARFAVMYAPLAKAADAAVVTCACVRTQQAGSALLRVHGYSFLVAARDAWATHFFNGEDSKLMCDEHWRCGSGGPAVPLRAGCGGWTPGVGCQWFATEAEARAEAGGQARRLLLESVATTLGATVVAGGLYWLMWGRHS